MSYDIQVRQRQENLPEAVDPYALPGADGQGEPQEGVFIKVHRLLRGRYHWALLLGLVLGGGGGYFGYKAKQPMWSSTGMIHIRPYIAPLLRPSEETGAMNAYQSFRETQVSFLRQQRVIENALQSPEWRALNRPGTSDEVWQDFLTRLQVDVPPGNETVLVTFTHPDPAACVAAVKGVLRAYSTIYLEKEERQQEEKLRTLQAIRISYTSERDAKREAIRSIAREFGTDDLRPIHQTKQTSLNQLESELAQLEVKLAAVGPGANGPNPGPVVPKLPKDLTAADIAQVEPKMRQMYDEYQEGDNRLAKLLEKLGENHPDVKESRNTQEIRKLALDRYAEQWRQEAAKNGNAPVAVRPGPAAMIPPQLVVARKQYQERIQTLQKELKDMGLKMLDIER